MIVIPLSQISTNIHFSTRPFRCLFQSAESSHPPDQSKNVNISRMQKGGRSRIATDREGLGVQFFDLPLAFTSSSPRRYQIKPEFNQLINNGCRLDLRAQEKRGEMKEKNPFCFSRWKIHFFVLTSYTVYQKLICCTTQESIVLFYCSKEVSAAHSLNTLVPPWRY